MRLALAFLALMAVASADDRGALQTELARSEEIARVSTSTTERFEAACRGADCAFRLAQPEGERSSEWARRGIALAEKARALRAERVEGHYLFALCLGIELREHKLSGITRTDDLIEAARRAVELDETYDRGGPHRLLALLYAEAPRVIGPGDHDLARRHANRLLLIAGEDDENRLAAARVFIEVGDRRRARELLAKVDPARAPDEATRKERREERARLLRDLD